MAQEDEPTGEMVVYQSQDGTTRVECRFADETLWLSQSLIAELFQTTPQNVTQHLRSIFREGELNPEATCKDFLQVRQEGERKVRRQVKHYNLDAILAVGYRVQVFLQDWDARLDEFLRFNERDVLADKGAITKVAADSKALAEYEVFAARRRTLLEAEGERAQRSALEKASEDLWDDGKHELR